MALATESDCASCGKSNGTEALVCGLCGALLPRSRAEGTVLPNVEPASMPGVAPGTRTPFEYGGSAESRARGRSEGRRAERTARVEPWFYLGLGLLTAPVFAWTPFLGFMGWFLGALVHEMGHCALALLCGMPAVPAISLAGHAAAVHGEQMFLLVAAVVFAIASGIWRMFEGRTRTVLLAIFGIAYPVLAFTGVREFAFLVAGHFGELAFATLCLFKALSGGFTSSQLERALYGTLGWFLLGVNLLLTGGLMFSATSRAEYAASGSFGLTNDYLRVAQDILGCSVQIVAFGMTVVGLCTLPIAFWLWRVSQRASGTA
jgi:hypothetical protein